MSEQRQNYIGGAQVAGDAAANISPSNTADVVGHYARANADQASDAIAAGAVKLKGKAL